MKASKTQNNEANLKKGQYFQFIVSKLSKLNTLSKVDAQENFAKLNFIRKEKNSGHKKLKPITIVKGKEEPFKIPENWLWLTIKDVIKLTENFNIQSKLNSEELINYVDISCIDNGYFKIKDVKTSPVHELSSRARRVLKKGFFLYSLVRPYLNNMAVVDDEKEMMIASTGFSVFDSFYLENDFLKYWFLSPFIKDYFNEMISGFNSPSISMNQFLDTPVPVAPLEEQKAIISFFSSLESNANKKNNALPEDLISGIIELDNLQKYSTTISENIEKRKLLIPQLKQSILQEAIKGKLTTDWRAKMTLSGTEVEPTSELLKRIKAEKAQLIKEKKIKKEKTLPPISEEEVPFDLPEDWVWCRLIDLCSHIADIDHNMPKAVENGVKFLSAKDLLDNGTLNFTKKIKYISEEDFQRLSRKIQPKRNDIIYSRIGANLGKARIVETDEKFIVSYSCCTIRTLLPNIKYLNMLMDSSVILSQAITDTTSHSIPDLGMGKIKAFKIPLPSAEEQKEIVKKVEALMQYCQELEQEIKTSEANAQMLMQAVLKEAFEGKRETVTV